MAGQKTAVQKRGLLKMTVQEMMGASVREKGDIIEDIMETEIKTRKCRRERLHKEVASSFGFVISQID